MSLTREQWCEMWNEIKMIELEVRITLMNRHRKSFILEQVEKIKTQIQSVIGQME